MPNINNPTEYFITLVEKGLRPIEYVPLYQ